MNMYIQPHPCKGNHKYTQPHLCKGTQTYYISRHLTVSLSHFPYDSLSYNVLFALPFSPAPSPADIYIYMYI